MTDHPKVLLAKAILSEIQSIVAGADYHFTPGESGMGYKTYEECNAFPAYYVSIGAGGLPIEDLLNRRRLRHFTIMIHGHIHDAADPVTAIGNAMADVEKAVFKDVTHGHLASQTRLLNEPVTDEGWWSPYGSFDMPINVSYYESY